MLYIRLEIKSCYMFCHDKFKALIWLVGWFYGMSIPVGLFNVKVFFFKQLYGIKQLINP